MGILVFTHGDPHSHVPTQHVFAESSFIGLPMCHVLSLTASETKSQISSAKKFVSSLCILYSTLHFFMCMFMWYITFILREKTQLHLLLQVDLCHIFYKNAGTQDIPRFDA